MDFGKLKKISPRDVWGREDLDFTNWLSESDNLGLLSDELGIEMSVVETESSVGSFKVDILAKGQNGDKIVIENQLERTDHDHLGKIITYASGKNASTVIWIVREFKEEHKQAVDWLNEYTDPKLKFFLLKLEIWQIGDSKKAPKFQIISRPNDWAKAVKESSSQRMTSPKAMQLYDFWNKFNEYATDQGAKLGFSPVRPTAWYPINIGHSSANIILTLSKNKKEIGCRLNIKNAEPKELYKFLLKEKAQIETKIGFKLQWEELPNRDSSAIFVKIEVDWTETKRWKECFKWCLEKSVKFNEVFPSLIKNFEQNPDPHRFEQYSI